MKILTKKKLEGIKNINYEKGKNDGIELIIDFLKKFKNINIYNKPIYFKTNKVPIIKNSLFAKNEYGIYIITNKNKIKK